MPLSMFATMLLYDAVAKKDKPVRKSAAKPAAKKPEARVPSSTSGR